MSDHTSRVAALAVSSVLAMAFEVHCGARTALPTGDPCAIDGTERACNNVCGAGKETCKDGFWGVCVAPPASRACSNTCGEGVQSCVAGAWSPDCTVPVATRPCTSVCGAGTETCADDTWQPCDAPSPRPPTLRGTVRRFLVQQPDFLDTCCSGGPQPGIVAFDLGSDGKPVYVGTPGPVSTTHGAFYFNEWYNDVPGINESMPSELAFTASLDGGAEQSVFDAPSFDPFMVFGDGGAIPDFTLEAHGEILYVGGETYSFSSDDDLWVFINRRLAVDLGGLHPPLSASIDLDSLAATLGIVKGQSFLLDLFYANREPPGATLVIGIPETDLWACPL